MKALGQLTIKKDSFKQGSPDAVMLITGELPMAMGVYFKMNFEKNEFKSIEIKLNYFNTLSVFKI